MDDIIYVAISKEKDRFISGAKGQFAFCDKTTLKRSVNYALKYKADKLGVKPTDLYEVYEISLTKVLQQ